MWSEVIALDMLSAFKANMLDPAVGARYRDTILAQGGQEEEMNLVKRFLGANPRTRRSSRRSPAGAEVIPDARRATRDRASSGKPRA
jgi:thimet oligopeptidase